MKKLLFLAAAAMAVPVVASAQYTTEISIDFETDASSDFNVVTFDGSGGSGVAIDFEFDYVADGIPLAPNSQVGDTQGVQINLTSSGTGGTAANLIIDTAGLAEPLSNYILKFDLYASVPTPGTAAQTSEFIYYGSSDGSAIAYGAGATGADFNGFIFGHTNDGGYNSDYVYYESIGPGTGSAYYQDAPAWWDAGQPGNAALPNYNNTDADWEAFFDVASGAATLGTGRNIWVTVEVEVTPDPDTSDPSASGSVATVYYTLPGGTRTRVSSENIKLGDFADAAVNTNSPVIGYGDINATASPADVFIVVDNVEILVADEPTNVDNWQMFQ